MAVCADYAGLATIIEDFATGPLSSHGQGEVFLATVFMEEGAFVFMNIVSVLQGDFAECPGFDSPPVFLIVPVLRKDVQGIIGLIDTTVEDYAAIAVLGAGEDLALYQIVKVGLQCPLLPFCRT